MPTPASTKIAAGELRHRLQILQPTLTQDSAGGTVIDQDTVLAEVWGKIETLAQSRYMKEVFAAQQITSVLSHVITIRWYPGIKAKQNVGFNGRFFQIEAVADPDERRKLLILMCNERNESAGAQAPS